MGRIATAPMDPAIQEEDKFPRPFTTVEPEGPPEAPVGWRPCRVRPGEIGEDDDAAHFTTHDTGPT